MWTITAELEHKLLSFDIHCQRRLLWLPRDCIWNEEDIRAPTRQRPLPDLVKQHQLCWLGHIHRMSPSRLPGKALYSLPNKRLPHGCPCLYWIDKPAKEYSQSPQKNSPSSLLIAFTGQSLSKIWATNHPTTYTKNPPPLIITGFRMVPYKSLISWSYLHGIIEIWNYWRRETFSPLRMVNLTAHP